MIVALIDKNVKLENKLNLLPGSIHENNCNEDEGFVSLSLNNLGVCIEKTERLTQKWIDADNICKSLGKRLPDYHEWKKACETVSDIGLRSMTKNWEWASSTPSASFGAFDGNKRGAASIIAGGNDCGSVSFGWIRRNGGDEYSFKFRCVR